MGVFGRRIGDFLVECEVVWKSSGRKELKREVLRRVNAKPYWGATLGGFRLGYDKVRLEVLEREYTQRSRYIQARTREAF